MPMIRETILITNNEDWGAHIAPLGLIEEGEFWIAAPFRPSRTLDNLSARPQFTANVTDDVRVFAGCLTGRKYWPVVPADEIEGWRLADCLAHYELEVTERIEDEVRPRFRCRVVHKATHHPAPGFNRAQGAVIEAAILASRLHMLSPEKIRGELAYLEIAIEKTAGPREAEAWSWLREKIDAHLAADLLPSGDPAARQR
jgi:hypothetical protein